MLAVLPTQVRSLLFRASPITPGRKARIETVTNTR
ncbi:hypothetical protein SAMN05216551_10360 [Chitinasiproducens palmae]|uniref:Uncharacterized protein n=1 Tax=Chitinasiproducens palmae TaxID=1770053 RepID=A0A1H2PLX7_9BURK|nr:hypothetical protein SAMN05216551_10360 [Chitinasiproducens palmae]